MSQQLGILKISWKHLHSVYVRFETIYNILARCVGKQHYHLKMKTVRHLEYISLSNKFTVICKWLIWIIRWISLRLNQHQSIFHLNGPQPTGENTKNYSTHFICIPIWHKTNWILDTPSSLFSTEFYFLKIVVLIF